MTLGEIFFKLSTTLNSFNDTLNQANKLDDKALKIMQDYLLNSNVTVLKQGDIEKLQRPVNKLELLTNETILARVSPTIMEQINRQLIRLAELIIKDPEKTRKDAFFIIVKLEVCFLKILSEGAIEASKQREKFYEEKMAPKQSSEPLYASSRSRAMNIIRKQPLINELMSAALLDVLEYFEKKDKYLLENFKYELAEMLDDIGEYPDMSMKDPMGNDVRQILRKSAEDSNLSIGTLILHLKSVILGFNKRSNNFTVPLQTYIKNTESPTLSEFNKTIDSSSSLSSEEVNRLEPLFKLYCQRLLTSPNTSPEESTKTGDTSSTKPYPQQESTDTGSRTVPKLFSKTLPQESSQTDSSEAAVTESMASINIASSLTEEQAPPFEDETNLKFVWVEPNLEDFYEEFRRLIDPAPDTPCSVQELKSYMAADWIGSRIFLCMSTTHIHDLLPHIHSKSEFYRIYVLCQNKEEENKYLKESKEFRKIRILTSSQQEFIRQLSLDMIQSLIDVADIYFREEDYRNAIRWYESALQKLNRYSDSKHPLYPVVKQKITQCSRS